MASSESRVGQIPHFDIHVTDKNVDATVNMLISHIKKSWKDRALSKKVFNDGITNQLFGYYVDQGGLKTSTKFGEYGRSDIILVRIYGLKSELIIDRAQELRNFVELKKFDLAPTLYCTFENGYCYKFLEGRVLGADDFQDPTILIHDAKHMAKLHALDLSEDYLKHHQMQSTLFATMRKYLSLVPMTYGCPEKQKKFEEKIPSRENLLLELETVQEAVEAFESKFGHQRITFCHNDLLCANFIYDEHDETLHTIDYEYGAPNYAAYDIANHFDEFAGIDSPDYGRYPSKSTQVDYLKNYLKHTNEITSADLSLCDESIEELYVFVNLLSLASHLFWGIWALVQAHFSQIDFEYLEYGSIRLNEHFARKEGVFAMLESRK